LSIPSTEPPAGGRESYAHTQTGKFSVPAVFAEHNAKARMLPKPKARRG
jgi:hypothetical protein